MAITKSDSLDIRYPNIRDLDKIPVYREDGDKFFQITKLPEVLTYGKHAFLLSWFNNDLKDESPIDFEFKDAQGNIIYSDVSDYEVIDGSILCYVWIRQDPLRIYSEIANGLATLTIVGEATNVPNQWKGKPNVRYTKTVNIEKALPNTSPIVFDDINSIQKNSQFLTITYQDTSLKFNQVFPSEKIHKRNYLSVSMSHMKTVGGKVDKVEVSYLEQQTIRRADTTNANTFAAYRHLNTYPLSSSFQTSAFIDVPTVPFELSSSVGLNPLSDRQLVAIPPLTIRRNSLTDFRFKFLTSDGKYAQDFITGEDVVVTASLEVSGSPLILETDDNIVTSTGSLIFGDKVDTGFKLSFSPQGFGSYQKTDSIEFTRIEAGKADSKRSNFTADGGFFVDSDSNPVTGSDNAAIVAGISSSITSSRGGIIVGSSGSNVIKSLHSYMVGGVNNQINQDNLIYTDHLGFGGLNGIIGGQRNKISSSANYTYRNAIIASNTCNIGNPPTYTLLNKYGNDDSALNGPNHIIGSETAWIQGGVHNAMFSSYQGLITNRANLGPQNNILIGGRSNHISASGNYAQYNIMIGGDENRIDYDLAPGASAADLPLFSTVIGGKGNIMKHHNSYIIGGYGIESNAPNTTYVDNLNVSRSISATSLNVTHFTSSYQTSSVQQIFTEITSSGNSNFGNDAQDVHRFSGNVVVGGSGGNLTLAHDGSSHPVLIFASGALGIENYGVAAHNNKVLVQQVGGSDKALGIWTGASALNRTNFIVSQSGGDNTRATKVRIGAPLMHSNAMLQVGRPWDGTSHNPNLHGIAVSISSSGHIVASGAYFGGPDDFINPNSALTVQGDVSASGDLYVNGWLKGTGSAGAYLTVSGAMSASGGYYGTNGATYLTQNVIYWRDTDGSLGPGIKATHADYPSQYINFVSGSDTSFIFNTSTARMGIGFGNSSVDIGTINPKSTLTVVGDIFATGSAGHITASGNITSSGTITAHDTFDVSNRIHGKMLPNAFGVSIGTDNGVQNTSVQYGGVCIGYRSHQQFAGITIGHSANTSYAVNNIAIGYSASAVSLNNIAIGREAVCHPTWFNIGSAGSGNASAAMAIGDQATASNAAAVALGPSAHGGGQFSTALGYKAKASGSYGIGIGYFSGNSPEALNGIGIGAESQVSGAMSIALGYRAKVSGNHSVFIYTSGSKQPPGGYSTQNNTDLNYNNAFVIMGSGSSENPGASHMKMSLNTTTGSVVGLTVSGSISASGDFRVKQRIFETGSVSGDIVKFGQTSGLTAGDVYMLNTNGTWIAANANSGSTTTGSLAVALGASAVDNGMLIRGMVNLDNDPSANVGAPVYVSTTDGHLQSTAPNVAEDIVRVAGYYMSGSGTIYFNPDNTWVEIS